MREATETVAILLSLVAPYTAEEMWERLGHRPTVARTTWPTVDPTLLVAPDITAEDLEALALGDAHVQRAIDGRPVRKVVVRAPKLVNIVVG